MPRRYSPHWKHLGSSLLLSCIAFLGCAGNSPMNPLPAENDTTPSLGATLLTGPSLSLSAPAIYRWQIDPATLNATSTLLATRSAQDNDGRFLLPVDNFLRPDSLRVDRIRATADTLELDYSFTHPFASSDVSNRADLGFSGYLLFLTDVDSATGNTFHNDLGDPVILNRDLITNAHAYWSPADLLSLSGFTANTFPYRLIANDGGSGNRVDPVTGAPIFNNGMPDGNYDPAAGWFGLQGFSKDWTGFDVLHQGQAATGVLTLSREALAATGTFSLDVAVIAKYADPKSASPGFEHRLPTPTPDVLNEFAYRYPYGALDVSRITWEGQTANFITNTTSFAEFNFHIRDWDARATPTSSPIAEVDDPMAVPTSEVGAPNVFWSCPALFGPNHNALLGNVPTSDDSAFGGDPEQDSGYAGDGLFYQLGVERTGVPEDVRGTYPALVQFLDQGTLDQPTVFLDADLQPLSGAAPRNTTYWPCEVYMEGPLGSGWARQIAGEETEFISDIEVGPDGQVWVGGVFNEPTDFGGGVRTSEGALDCFVMAYDKYGNYLWDRTWGSAFTDTFGGIGVRTDGVGALVTSAYNDTMTFEGTPYTQTFGDGFLLQLDSNGTTVSVAFVKSEGNDEQGDAISTGADLGYYLCGSIGLNAEIAGTAVPTVDDSSGFTARLTQFGDLDWAQIYPNSGVAVAPTSLTVLPSGAVITSGGWFGEADFGGGVRTSTRFDIYVVRHSAVGAYVWDRTFGTSEQDQNTAIASGFGGRIVLVGLVRADIDFGGGVHPVPTGVDSAYAVSLTAAGTYEWSQVFQHSATGGSKLLGVGILPGSGGDVMIGGSVSEDSTFASLPFEVTVNNGFYARLDETTGEGISATVLSSNYNGEVQNLHLGPADSVYYGLEVDGPTDVEPGPGVTNLTASGGFADVGVVKLYADNTW